MAKKYSKVKVILYNDKGKKIEWFDMENVTIESETHNFYDDGLKGKYCFSIIKGIRWVVGRKYAKMSKL